MYVEVNHLLVNGFFYWIRVEIYWNMRNEQKFFPICYSKNVDSLTITAAGTQTLIVHCMCIYDIRYCVIQWWKFYGINKYTPCNRSPPQIRVIYNAHETD